MVKDIVKDPEQLAKPAEKATAEDAQVAQDLLDTLASLEEVAGLAANQIGSDKAVIVYLDDDENPRVMYNPVFKRGLGPMKMLEECVSLDGESKVTRYARAMITYDELVDGELQPQKREFEGFTSQVIQHLIDHCKGKVV